MKWFEIKDIEGYLKYGDYSSWHMEWQREMSVESEEKSAFNPYRPFGNELPPQTGYQEWLEKVLIPSWHSVSPVTAYSNGCIYGVEDGRGVDLDYDSGLDDLPLFADIASEFGGEIESDGQE